MSDPLLPSGISLGSGVAEDGGPTVIIDLGKLLQLGDVTVKIVLPADEAMTFGERVYRQGMRALDCNHMRVIGWRE